MTLEEKVGQTLCFGFAGTYPHPDILAMVEKYHVAGFRVTPAARKFKRYFGPDHPGTPRVVRKLERLEREYGGKKSIAKRLIRSTSTLVNLLKSASSI